MSDITVERDGRIACLVFDQADRPVNTLSIAVGEELTRCLDRLRDDPGVDAVVLRSGKSGVFIAGADIEAFVRLDTAEAGERLSRQGQHLVERIAAFPKPLVVAIHGPCLGGGLELAMAATCRVASDAAETRLGLPESQLGLIPGMTGCHRLPRLVGLRAALDLILTGRPVSPRKALRIGLVQEVVPPAILTRAAVSVARRLAEGWTPPRRRRGVAGMLLDGNPVGRWLVFRQAAKHVRKRTGGHYPAPPAAIEVVRTGLTHGSVRGLAEEAAAFGRLAVSAESRNLVQIFFATTALKKDRGVDGTVDEAPRIDRLGIVGAGFMGAAIAGVAALKANVDVRLRDTDWPRVANGLAAARQVLASARTRRRIDRHEHYRLGALLSGTPDDSGFTQRDLVVEAVFEDLETKRDVLASLETTVTDTCILASNTSTIPIGDLQQGARRPERIIGMHFFSPVERMPLLEVIRGPETSDATTAAAVRFGQRMGKTVIVVRDSPGFWVNRILAPYLNEAGWLLDEGATIEQVDFAMTAFGFPVGPIALLDEIGLDVAHKAAGVLAEAFGARLAPAPAVGALVTAGRLGRKSGGGFYRYVRGKRKDPDPATLSLIRQKATAAPPTSDDIRRRPILAMINEAVRASADQVVRSARDGDIGAVFGFGFPPFRGGPLRYVDQIGARTLVDELTALARRHGERFEPAPRLVEMAAGGRTFHEEARRNPPLSAS